MNYEIEYIGTNAGWKYRVTLWNGKARYNGDRYYMCRKDAERAAQSTGAAPKSVKEPA